MSKIGPTGATYAQRSSRGTLKELHWNHSTFPSTNAHFALHINKLSQDLLANQLFSSGVGPMLRSLSSLQAAAAPLPIF